MPAVNFVKHCAEGEDHAPRVVLVRERGHAGYARLPPPFAGLVEKGNPYLVESVT